MARAVLVLLFLTALALAAAAVDSRQAKPPEDSAISTADLATAWTELGMRLRDANDLDGAVAAQSRAAYHAPFFAHTWRQVCVGRSYVKPPR